ncbi:MAG: hypothetical protein KAX19_00890, partial [Candidatus Brocadiae bacterium]|nr:hypothetical protein [Candidatus Brocadiia bacterium]
THNRGGSLLFSQEPYDRKAQYWAFWLWRHYMGDSVLECSADGPDWLRVFATRSDDALYVMAINSSREKEALLNAHLDNFEPAPQGEEALLSVRQCFWDRVDNRPRWSAQPLVFPLDVGPSFAVSVPPLAIKCVRVPTVESAGLSERALLGRQALAQDHGPAELRVAIAPSSYEDTEVAGWVRAYRAGTDDPYPVALPNARLEVSGPAEADPAEVRLAEAAGPFTLRPTGPGEAVVKAVLDDLTATGKVLFQKSEPRPQVLWEFEADSLGRGYRSHWELSTDDSIRANQRVARIDLPGVVPDQQHRELLVMDLPRRAGIRRENIRGVFLDLNVSRDFQCDDPNARIEIIMQSPADYWMSLGSVPLPKAGDRWRTHTVTVTDPKHIKAVYAAYNVWFVLHSE